MGVLDIGPSSVTDTPLGLLPLINVEVGVAEGPNLLVEISGDCCGSRTRFEVHSAELCMMWRFEGRLVRRDREGRMSGKDGVVGGVENVSLSGECIVRPRSVFVRQVQQSGCW